jgi:hypothetical protein
MKDAVSRIGDPEEVAAAAVTDVGMDGAPVDKKVRWLCPRTEPLRKCCEKAIGAEKFFAIGVNS